jgi:hypothetical protein
MKRPARSWVVAALAGAPWTQETYLCAATCAVSEDKQAAGCLRGPGDEGVGVARNEQTEEDATLRQEAKCERREGKA